MARLYCDEGHNTAVLSLRYSIPEAPPSVLDRITLAAVEAGPRLAPPPTWRRFQDAAMGLSFEVPFELPIRKGSFGIQSDAFMTLPFVLDTTYLSAPNDAHPEALSWAMAAQWSVDYNLVAGVCVRQAEYPGIDEAWILSADVSDDAGILGSTWATLRRNGRLACVGVNCWAAEPAGRAASERILGSITGL